MQQTFTVRKLLCISHVLEFYQLPENTVASCVLKLLPIYNTLSASVDGAQVHSLSFGQAKQILDDPSAGHQCSFAAEIVIVLS